MISCYVPHVNKLFTYAASLISSHQLMVHSSLLSPFVPENVGALTGKSHLPKVTKAAAEEQSRLITTSAQTQSPECQISMPRRLCRAPRCGMLPHSQWQGVMRWVGEEGVIIAANLGSLFPVYCPLPTTPMNPIQSWGEVRD